MKSCRVRQEFLQTTCAPKCEGDFADVKEVQATTTVVIITVFIFAGYFFIVDGIIGRTLDWAFHTLVAR